MARIVTTPRVVDADFSRDGARSYWKRVLPKSTIDYTDKHGKTRQLTFDDRYLDDIKAAFDEGGRDVTPFSLADADNRHSSDPELYRGEVVDYAREHALPEDVRAQLVTKHGAVPEGLYSKIRFASKKAAKAVVMSGHKLPVSMRIRELSNPDGSVKPVGIHVCGTLDPQIPKLGDWLPTVDLSDAYASDDVLDLSDQSYPEATKMPKKKKKDDDVDLSTAVLVPDIDDVSPEDIESWDDATVAAFIEQYASEDDEGDSDDADDADDETDTDEDDSDDDEDEDTDMSKRNSGEDLDFSAQKADIDLARRDARQALNRAAEMRWAAERAAYQAAGVPPFVLDLTEPLLSRANDTVIDLSNYDEDDIDVTDMVRQLVDATKGTIDLSSPQGHGDAESDASKATREAFERLTADL